MKKTVLITGSSTGIGNAAARYFFDMGWNVIATMRNPGRRETTLHKIKGIELIHLDVTDRKSIKNAVKFTLEKYKRIGVLVNNAGYAIFGPFENSTPKQVKRQIDTNIIGLIDLTREVLPVMRKQKSGTI